MFLTVKQFQSLAGVAFLVCCGGVVVLLGRVKYNSTVCVVALPLVPPSYNSNMSDTQTEGHTVLRSCRQRPRPRAGESRNTPAQEQSCPRHGSPVLLIQQRNMTFGAELLLLLLLQKQRLADAFKVLRQC